MEKFLPIIHEKSPGETVFGRIKRKNTWPQEFLILYHSSMSVKMDPLKRGKYFERGEWDLHVTAAEIFRGSRLR